MSRLSLWHFIFNLLESESESESEIVVWKNKEQLEFKIIDGDKLALAWGLFKKRNNMTYAKVARAIRYYYGMGILEKVCCSCNQIILRDGDT